MSTPFKGTRGQSSFGIMKKGRETRRNVGSGFSGFTRCTFAAQRPPLIFIREAPMFTFQSEEPAPNQQSPRQPRDLADLRQVRRKLGDHEHQHHVARPRKLRPGRGWAHCRKTAGGVEVHRPVGQSSKKYSWTWWPTASISQIKAPRSRASPM